VFGERAWVDSLVAGAGHRSCGLRAPRYSGRASPPNKPMHPTADTVVVIYLRGVARRVIGGVRRA
jgi:hypothetical protein